MQPLHQDNLNCRYKDDLFFRVSDGENGSCDVFGHSHSTVSILSFLVLLWQLASPTISYVCLGMPHHTHLAIFNIVEKGVGVKPMLKTKLQIPKIYIKINMKKLF